jgi:hypothetical protein
MPSRDPVDPGRSSDPIDPIEDELIGLDPDDPETRAFAEHLGRMRNDRPSFTIEGYLHGVSDFADSANRAQGGRRLGAVVLVLLLLLVAVYLIMDALGFVVSTWFSAAPAVQSAHVTNSFDTKPAAGISVEA